MTFFNNNNKQTTTEIVEEKMPLFPIPVGQKISESPV